MRRFEFSEGSSSKFWQIELQGTSFTVQYGKLGTAGQTQTKDFDSEAKAQAEYDKLIKEKTKKGYAEVGVEDGASLAAVAPKPKKEEAAETAATPAGTSAATAAAPPVAAAPDTEGEVVWTPEGLNYLYTYFHTSPRPPEATTGDGWALLKERWATFGPKWRVDDLHVEPEVKSAFEEALAFLDGDAPVPLSVLGAAVVLAMLGIYGEYHRAMAWAIAAPSIQAHGWGWVLDVVLNGGRVTTSPYIYEIENGTHKHFFGISLAAVTPTGGMSPGFAQTILKCIDTQPEADTLYAALVEALTARWPSLNYHQRLAALHLAPSETPLADTLAQEWLATDGLVPHHVPNSWDKEGIKPSFTFRYSLPLALQLAKKAQAMTYNRHALSSSLHLFLAYYGVAGLALIKQHFDRSDDSRRCSSVAYALQQVTGPEAMRMMVNMLGEERDIIAVVRLYCLKHPALALVALGNALAGRPKQADVAGPIFLAVDAANPGLLAQVAGKLTPTGAAAVAKLREKMMVRPEASREELPAILVNPPWASGKKPPSLPVVEGVTLPPAPEAIHWEREDYQAEQLAYWTNVHTASPKTLAEIEREYFGDRWRRKSASWNLLYTSQEEMKTALATWPLDAFSYAYQAEMFRNVLGLESIPGYLRVYSASPTRFIEVLRTIESARLAPLFAHFRTLKSTRKAAEAWLLAYPGAAITGLLPVAVGPHNAERVKAEAALRWLAKKGQEGLIREIAATASPAQAVLAALDAVLSFDPRLAVPAKIPKLGGFWQPGSLPRPFLKAPNGSLDKSQERSLPLSAMEHLAVMLAISTPEAVYVGLEDVLEVCDLGSLEDFSWGLFNLWSINGAPSKENWAFLQLGILGRNEVARRLTPLIREWPGESLQARAVTGLDILARIGTDLALMNLNGVAQKIKFKGLQEKAREKMDEVASNRGLSAEELADRLVPDLDLEPDGTRVLDFGPRQFTVCFDEALKPFVKDANGKALPDLPKATKQDDAEKAKEADTAWKALKKDAKAIATTQVTRLELSMCGQRRWEIESWRALLVEHPLLINLVRRVIWGGVDAPGPKIATFRVAEDASLADAEDTLYVLPDGEEIRVGIAHALELSAEERGAWGQILGDYQIVQPFAQIGRDVYAPTAEELDKPSVGRRSGEKVPTGKVRGLVERGWQRGPAQDAGLVWEMLKHLPGGVTAELHLDEGFSVVGYDEESPAQTLSGVSLYRAGSKRSANTPVTVAEIGAVAFSELVRDIIQLGKV